MQKYHRRAEKIMAETPDQYPEFFWEWSAIGGFETQRGFLETDVQDLQKFMRLANIPDLENYPAIDLTILLYDTKREKDALAKMQYLLQVLNIQYDDWQQLVNQAAAKSWLQMQSYLESHTGLQATSQVTIGQIADQPLSQARANLQSNCYTQQELQSLTFTLLSSGKIDLLVDFVQQGLIHIDFNIESMRHAVYHADVVLALADADIQIPNVMFQDLWRWRIRHQEYVRLAQFVLPQDIAIILFKHRNQVSNENFKEFVLYLAQEDVNISLNEAWKSATG